MSLLTPEQIAAAQKAHLESLFGLTSKAFESVEKLIELNVQVVKSTLAESQENVQRALSVKDAQELLALQASFAQPLAEKALAYGRHLYDIASSTQAEFAKVAESQYEEQNRKVQALVDNVAKDAPAGSETAVAALKSAINAANTTYETVQKATKQAVEIAESNFKRRRCRGHQGCQRRRIERRANTRQAGLRHHQAHDGKPPGCRHEKSRASRGFFHCAPALPAPSHDPPPLDTNENAPRPDKPERGRKPCVRPAPTGTGQGTTSYFFLRTGGRSVQTPFVQFGGHPDRLAERRVRVDRLADVLGVRAHLDGQADLADQVARIQADDAAADHAMGFLVEDQLGEALVADRSRSRGPMPPRGTRPCRT